MKHVYKYFTFRGFDFRKYKGVYSDAAVPQGEDYKVFDEYIGDRIDSNDQVTNSEAMQMLPHKQ